MELQCLTTSHKWSTPITITTNPQKQNCPSQILIRTSHKWPPLVITTSHQRPCRTTFCAADGLYYINTNEIPGELSHENLISSHVKISPLLYWLHNKSRPSHQKLLKWNGLIFHWCLYNKQNITWPLGDTKFLFLCWKNISSLEEKFHISVRPCYINILYSLYKHQQNRIYMADSIKVALQGIGKLLLGSHLSKSLHCSICPKDQFITKATFLDLAVCQVSFSTKTWYLHMWKFRVIFTCEKITVATAT